MGKIFFTQLKATVFNLMVTAITKNVSKWKCKNNKSHITRLRKTLHIPLLFVPFVGSNISFRAHNSAEEN